MDSQQSSIVGCRQERAETGGLDPRRGLRVAGLRFAAAREGPVLVVVVVVVVVVVMMVVVHW